MNFSKLTAYLDSLRETYGIPMSDIKIMQSHEEIYRYRFGYADFAKKVPLTADHLFRLYSASKLITMTASLQLIESGRLHFDDKLQQYLPEYAAVRVVDDAGLLYGSAVAANASSHPAQKPITIRQLMSMSAGFSYDTADENIRKLVRDTNAQATTREIIAALAKTPLLYEPGEHWHYSLAHDVMAAVVESVSGQTFGDYLKEHIFEPLGANDFYFTSQNSHLPKERVCDIYSAVDDAPPFVEADPANRDQYYFSENYESGGAGLIGSVDAYSLVTDALACGGIGKSGKWILKPETVALFRKAVITDGQPARDFALFNRTGYAYGLGVRVLVDGNTSPGPVGEFGWDGAAGAYALIDTDRELSVFYAGHILNFSDHYYVIHPKLRNLIYECL